MTEPSPAMTDPAREMAELLSSLASSPNNARGDKHLSENFGVAPWSQDFYRVIATIMDRLNALEKIVSELELDEDYREEMVGHIHDMAQAFTPSAFQNGWNQFGSDKLSARNVQPLKGLSGLVRQQVSYRKLSDEDIHDLVGQVTELTAWLREHQLSENDFIRQSLIEGLEHLAFRLERFRWLGWGYALESLKEVIAAYMILERQGVDANLNPDAAAILMKVGAVIKSVYAKIQKTKSAFDAADWLLKAYGAVSIFETARPAIKALIR